MTDDKSAALPVGHICERDGGWCDDCGHLCPLDNAPALLVTKAGQALLDDPIDGYPPDDPDPNVGEWRSALAEKIAAVEDEAAQVARDQQAQDDAKVTREVYAPIERENGRREGAQARGELLALLRTVNNDIGAAQLRGKAQRALEQAIVLLES